MKNINKKSNDWKQKKKVAYLSEPSGILEIESLSMLLYTKFELSKVSLVQLTGTMTENARNVMGTKIFSLHFNPARGCSYSERINIITYSWLPYNFTQI